MEEPDTNMDTEQQSSSLVLSAQVSEELLNPKLLLKTSTSDYPVDTQIAKLFKNLSSLHLLGDTECVTSLEFSTQELPSEIHSSEHHIGSATSQESSKVHPQKVPLSYNSEPLQTKPQKMQFVPPTAEEAHASETSVSQTSFGSLNKGKHLDFQMPPDSVTVSPFNAEQELTQTSGPSTQDHLSTHVKQEKATEKHEKGASASKSPTQTAQLGKKKEKKGYPEVPAKSAELTDMATALRRQKFHSQGKHLFHWAENTTLNATQSGLYIGWRCPHYLWDCFQIGDESKCFCGHLLREHKILSDISVPCKVSQCRCLMFCFIPSRPEEVGEFWLTRRASFDPKAWRAQCRCKHSHEEHAATGGHPCRVKGCCCACFESNFLCAACDRRWEEHETFFETEETRRRGGRPHATEDTSGEVSDSDNGFCDQLCAACTCFLKGPYEISRVFYLHMLLAYSFPRHSS